MDIESGSKDKNSNLEPDSRGDSLKKSCGKSSNRLLTPPESERVHESVDSDHASDKEIAGVEPALHLHGDETRLKQVLLNLVKNAFKFTPRGKVEATLRYDHQRSVLIGQVSDTGRGIARRDLSKLFSRFGKLQRTAEINHEGIGLGLTIVKKIIEQHHGSITVDSKGVGKGCTFKFEMQMAKAKAMRQDHNIVAVDKIQLERQLPAASL